MIELLLAAFIMGIGLLGLAALQTMSIRMAGVGTRMSDAVRLGELVIESASAEATQSILGERYQNKATSASKWIGGGDITEFYKYRDVDEPDGTKGSFKQAADATDGIFTVKVTQAALATPGRGNLTRIQVQVEFTETVAGGTPVKRTIQLVREVAHA